MAEQPAAPRRLPTSRYGKAWSLWPLRCAGLVMASGRTTGHRIAQSWRCRRAAVGPICAGSAAHGPRLSLDVLTRVSQALLMGLASWGSEIEGVMLLSGLGNRGRYAALWTRK